ncbi:protein kinase domain-containing protein [Legionella cardiaca]|uniref:Protein kinase n=1 Tax=Legionella cardiaca TaxID=1071983 RepID=A0ABY8AVK3_9GAMM|nr:protein kinase [Legionella cardiaca]WED43779.1 protein kinase [Legionella cardiaca]
MTKDTQLEKQTKSHANNSPVDPYLMEEKDFTAGGRILGKGNFGVVLKTTFRNRKAALKVSKEKNEAENERAIMRRLAELHKPYVVQLLGYMLYENHYFIAMEYMPKGSIENFIAQKTPIDWSLRYLWLTQITEGLIFLHENFIVHRDIKGANILLDHALNPKIADFGSAVIMKGEPLSGGVGTPLWIAPEIILEEPYNEKVDVYSLAITLWQIVCWDSPKTDKNYNEFLDHVVRGGRPPLPQNLPKKVAKLLTLGWLHEPDQRPSAKEYLVKLEETKEEILSASPMKP